MRTSLFLVLVMCFCQTGCLGLSSRLSESGKYYASFSIDPSDLPADFSPTAVGDASTSVYHDRSKRTVSKSSKRWPVNKTASMLVGSAERVYPAVDQWAFFPTVHFYYPYGEYDYSKDSRHESVMVDFIITDSQKTTCFVSSPLSLRGTYVMYHQSDVKVSFSKEWRSIGGSAAQLLLPATVAVDLVLSPCWLFFYAVTN